MNFQTETDFVFSSTEDEQEESSKKVKINLTEDKKQKFEQLKVKRSQIKAKHDRKRSSKPYLKSTEECEPHQTKSNILTNPIAVIQCEQIVEHSVSQLEKQLNTAISSNQVDLAETISDCLAQKQTELEQARDIQREKFQNELDAKKRKSEVKQKKKLAWRFEAKQKWETKSNM